MNTDLRPYPEYKDSGLPWLGRIPAHWAADRLKWLMWNVTEQSPVADPSEKYIALEHVESWTGRVRCAQATSVDGIVKWFKPNDVLFGKLRPYLAKVTRPQSSGVCVGEFFVLRERDPRFMPRYAEHLLRSQPIIGLVNGSTYGAKMPRAGWRFVGSVRVPVPSREEQKAIADYLDSNATRVRRLIRNRRRLIEVLNEQKQAIINRAVTRGLDPNAPLKPSGIDWLGDIPEHWRMGRVKTEMHNLNKRRVPLSGPERGKMTSRKYDYYGASGVIDKVEDYLFDDDLLLIAEDGANLVLRNLPLAIIAHGKFWVNNHAHILKPRCGSLEYFGALLECIDYSPWISGAAQPKLTKDRLMAVRIPVPPEAEQNAIVAWVNENTNGLTIAMVKAKREIDLIREYRTRLIADVVTGKLDVRHLAPSETTVGGEIREVEDLAEDIDKDEMQGDGEPKLVEDGS